MSDTFWVIGHRQGESRWVTVFGSHYGLLTDPEPGSIRSMGSKYTTPDKAVAAYEALEPGMFGLTGHVYEVTRAFEYVAGPLDGDPRPALSEVDPQLAMSPLGSSSASASAVQRGLAVGM